MENGWKITKKATCVYEREYVHMKGQALAAFFELYHASIAHVLSCIMLTFVADVLSCIRFPLLMS